MSEKGLHMALPYLYLIWTYIQYYVTAGLGVRWRSYASRRRCVRWRFASTGFSLCLGFMFLRDRGFSQTESTWAPWRLPEGQMTDGASNSRGTPPVWGKVPPPKTDRVLYHTNTSLLGIIRLFPNTVGTLIW